MHTLVAAHPDWCFSVLLRRVPATFEVVYPGIKIIHGDYDSAEVISQAAADADIVIHCGDSDHEASLDAIISGLLRRTTPGHLIHLSGTGIVSDWADLPFLGRLNPKIWSDLATSDLDEIRSLPDGALHRNTEKILHHTAREYSDRIHVAIMCPPDIYGRGHGLVKTASALLPFFVAEARKRGHVFYVNEGTNVRSWVHINDLMRVYLRVVDAAASNDAQTVQRFFGKNGYHFAATQEHSHMDVAKAVGEILAARGVIESPEPVEIALSELDGMMNLPQFPKLARYLYASNSRTRAERAKTLWGYEAEANDLLKCLEQDVLIALGDEK